ncbi:hypothetical protein JX266_012210 [Neoarthrinium moseri]|nr:hypothetical protein JX266_012210 [Neoarthrinium moseri]
MMLPDLAKKYAQEREKRMRPDGMNQFVDARSPLVQDLAKDPWVDYEALAAQELPVKNGDRVKFLIVGCGHNGLLFASRLIGAGFKSEDILLVDVAGGWGGTWYWNRYPGLMCDVEGYVYLPLLEETGYIPKHNYSFGHEIRGQSDRIAKKWNLQALFCTKVNEMKWDSNGAHWSVDMTRQLGTDREPTSIALKAQFVLSAGGILAVPKIPRAPGFQDFRARHHVFHTSRWDYAYTGGSQEIPDLVNLQDKRVAIIGTGATAVQAVPHLARWAKHLYVVQRTPSYCGERSQRLTTLESWKETADGTGWQERRSDNFNHMITNDPLDVDLVNDGWTDTPGGFGLIGNPEIVTPETVETHVDKALRVDAVRTEKVRARIAYEVRDPDTAEKLKPWYPSWCKRPTFNDDYLASFNRPNVTLIDTDGKGIDRFDQDGFVANGEKFEIDLLVMGTGFVSAAAHDPAERQDSKILGRDGRSIAEKWNSPDFGTLFGVASHQFPNFFAYHLQGSAHTYNMTSAFDTAAKLVAGIIAEASRTVPNAESLVIEATKEGEDRYTAEVKKRSLGASTLTICTPGYFTLDGELAKKPESATEIDMKARKAAWMTGINDFKRFIREFTDRKDLEGFTVSDGDGNVVR